MHIWLQFCVVHGHMNVIMVIIDGAQIEDYSLMKEVEQAEICKTVVNTPKGMVADSLNCIMNMLGVNPCNIPKGRSYLEALSAGYNVGENDIVFRCNGVSIENGMLASSCCERSLPSLDNGIELIHLNSYKNLLILKTSRQYFNDITLYEPHNHIGERLDSIMPKSKHEPIQRLLTKLVNEYSLYPWGHAVKVKVESFKSIHGYDGAVVCKTEIVRGIAKAMGMHVPKIEGTTADIDTDLNAKVRVALELSRNYHFTLLHINGADEAAHRRNRLEKEGFLKRIDKEVIGCIKASISNETMLIITSDHGTDCETGKHSNEPVAYYIFNRNEELNKWL